MGFGKEITVLIASGKLERVDVTIPEETLKNK